MKKRFIISFVLMTFLVAPSLAFAADGLIGSGFCNKASMSSVSGIVIWASCFLTNLIIPFLLALATAAFMYGVIRFYLNPDNEGEKKKGKNFIVGGLLALFMMVSMWGIVKVFSDTFEIKNAIPSITGIE